MAPMITTAAAELARALPDGGKLAGLDTELRSQHPTHRTIDCSSDTLPDFTPSTSPGKPAGVGSSMSTPELRASTPAAASFATR